MESFNNQFAGAADVSWYTTTDKYVAKFTMKSSKVTAHFDREGKPVWLLPVTLQTLNYL